MTKSEEKIEVVGVRFISGVKIYYFDPGKLDLKRGDYVVVESQQGYELAKVIYEKISVKTSELGEDELLLVVRMATKEDKNKVLNFHEQKQEFLAKAKELAQSLKLTVRFLDVSKSLDETNRLLFLFAAEGRVDFRELILKMSKTFKLPIRLYQVGPRDAARIVGGSGICGQELCCSRFLNKFESITMEIARDQDLVNMGSGKISGVCGKLLCCLDYEVEVYRHLVKQMPAIGKKVEVEKAYGEIIDRNILMQTVTVFFEESKLRREYPISEIKILDDQTKPLKGKK